MIIIEKIKDFFLLFKRTKENSKMVAVKEIVYKPKNETYLDSKTLEQASKELEIAEKEKNKLKDKKMTKKDLNTLSDLNNSALNHLDYLNKIK